MAFLKPGSDVRFATANNSKKTTPHPGSAECGVFYYYHRLIARTGERMKHRYNQDLYLTHCGIPAGQFVQLNATALETHPSRIILLS
ncbi:MAG: hypothetical protein MJ071_01650 [Oscillospiraceae bacterium]|nr:hypothetical protein [Oscillospiraceae bacterium]